MSITPKIAIISDVILEELENAPPEVRKLLSTIPDKFKEIVTLDVKQKRFPIITSMKKL